MSVARNLIPENIAVLLSPSLASAIATAAFDAEQRLTEREQAAEDAACALQWLEGEMNRHVTLCLECRRHACRLLRTMRRDRNRADRRYQKALRRLNGGR